jgi:hypothetical protein
MSVSLMKPNFSSSFSGSPHRGHRLADHTHAGCQAQDHPQARQALFQANFLHLSKPFFRT